MKQTDALIIAVALRYLAQDEERHEKVRARAEELRWQILHDNANQHTQCVGCVDTISRSQAIKDVSEWATDILHQDRLVKEDAIHILESLPSAEQVTGKLNNPDDSLLTADSEACKEQKSKLDLISRQDAIKVIDRERKKKHLFNTAEDGLLEARGIINTLPSAPDSRQRGEWIFEPKDAIELMFTLPKCSECGFESSDGGNFCSNCGARMKGGEDE